MLTEKFVLRISAKVKKLGKVLFPGGHAVEARPPLLAQAENPVHEF